MLILGIETSCDETSAAVVESKDLRLLANVISSQVPLHAPYSGVVPELASRAHLENLQTVIRESLAKAGVTLDDIETIAFTQGPGLKGALLVGEATARAMALALGIPTIGVHHLEAHLICPLFEYPNIRPPLLGLIISGGHTDLVMVRRWGDYKVLGRTLDDACGEAFDKFAKMMGLGYPGGPIIDKLAQGADRDAVRFPRPLLPGTHDFSFSGLKTSALYWLRDNGRPRGRALNDLAASFQEAIAQTLLKKSLKALAKTKAPTMVISGGVAANSRIREIFSRAAAEKGFSLYIPKPALCTDNGAMIALTAALMARRGHRPKSLDTDSTLPFKRW
ncbi:MAG: tRNA (adenosine(37)-N6)-threonylcarbamoyltransferase complex transferase subunit TsaD [Elusimicrobiota bacterium]